MLKIVECPRDAMQGLHDFIPTKLKIAYLQRLLAVGFDTLDCGSFVSERAIPQMRDTAEVLANVDWRASASKLLVIVANERGAQAACEQEAVRYIGYPFSVSETFQLRNTNATVAESVRRVQRIQELAQSAGKELIVYISMAFGNPYGDAWNVDIVQNWVNHLADMGVRIISLSDTIGVAAPDTIAYLFGNLIPPYPDVEFGAHFHTLPHNWREKVQTAYLHGCRRFDGALRGYGGCPMAKDDLTGNMPTEKMLQYFRDEERLDLGLDWAAFDTALEFSSQVFGLPV